MRLGSKRWHRACRWKWRRGCRKARRIIARYPEPVTEEQARRYNAAVRWLNQRVCKVKAGLPICDGIVDCPKCGKTLPLMADPQEWQWPLHGKRVLQVTSYWCGTAQCCGLLIADNFGRGEVYDLNAPKPPPTPIIGRNHAAYVYECAARWNGPAYRDAKANWDLFEEHYEDLLAIVGVYRRDHGVHDLVGRSHNPEGTLTAWLWKCADVHPWISDFCSHYQKLHLRRGIIAYCKQLLSEIEHGNAERAPELFPVAAS